MKQSADKKNRKYKIFDLIEGILLLIVSYLSIYISWQISLESEGYSIATQNPESFFALFWTTGLLLVFAYIIRVFFDFIDILFKGYVLIEFEDVLFVIFFGIICWFWGSICDAYYTKVTALNMTISQIYLYCKYNEVDILGCVFNAYEKLKCKLVNMCNHVGLFKR